MSLGEHGAQWHRGAVASDLDRLRTVLGCLPEEQAGVRISGLPALQPFLAFDGSIGSIASKVLGPASRPVRAILFDKSRAANWSLAWHQDRTICVRHRIDVPGFGPWTTKGGMQHVVPPYGLLGRMLTMRVHLDDVPITNAPLLVAPGSHRGGRIPVGEIGGFIRRHGIVTCLADAGDVWLYATPILHASEVASIPIRRRVLQVDFAAEALPGGLEWLGVR